MESNSTPNLDLNMDYLTELTGGSAEFMIEMIDIFLEQTPLYFEQMGEALQAGDWKNVAGIAHKIKPTFAFMGIDSAREDMQNLEHLVRKQESVAGIEPDYIRLKSLADQLYAKLEEVKTNLQENS